MSFKDSPTASLEHLEPRLLLSGNSVFAELFETAQLIDVQAADAVQINGSIDLAAQTQMYRFSAPARGKLWVEMNAQDGDLDSMVQVYNANGRRVGANDNASRATTDSLLRMGVGSGQDYYVLASGKNGTSGSYQITLTSDPIDDVGNTFAAAAYRRMSRGRARSRGTINYADDVDIIMVQTDSAGPMEIHVAGAGRGGYLAPELFVYDAEGNQIANDGGDGSSYAHASLTTGAGEVYYLKVVGTYGDVPGRYRLSVDIPVDDYGEALDAAGWLTLRRGRARASGRIQFTGDVDVFGVTAETTGPMEIRLTDADRKLQFDGELSVYDAEGNLLASQHGGASSQLTIDAVEGATYYMEVAGAYVSQPVRYRLTVTCPQDDISGLFDLARAIPLNGLGSGSARGTINFGTDTDTFSLVATKTGSMTVDVMASGRRNYLDPVVTIYDSSRQQIAYDDDGGYGTNSQATFDVTEGQTYYISVGSFGSSTGSYNVLVTTVAEVVPDPDPDPDPDPLPDPTPGPDDPTPGTDIVADIIERAEGLQLRVVGTDSAENMTISQSGSSLTLTTDSGSQIFAGPFTSVLIYGFGGGDTIRLTNSVTASSLIYAGAGDDIIYEAGAGSAIIFGGAGDDLLVTIGGGSDTLMGQEGFDSFWADSTDDVHDASTDETNAKAVHSITEFYQPFTTNSSSPDYVSLEIAGQDLTDPAATSSASGWSNYGAVPLFVDGPQFDDIAQGAIGDCYYLASLSALADTDPMVIQQMLTPLGDGTFAVRFNRSGQEVYLRIDADMPVNSSGGLVYAKMGPDGELWVPVAEKAYCFFRYGQNSYASINGGWMSTVLREITGGYTNTTYTSGSATTLYNHIAGHLAQGHAVTLASQYNAASPVVAGHAYMVKDAFTSGGQQYVTVFNPWGWDGRTWDADLYDGLLTLTIDQIQQNYSAAVTSLV